MNSKKFFALTSMVVLSAVLSACSHTPAEEVAPTEEVVVEEVAPATDVVPAEEAETPAVEVEVEAQS